MSFSVCLVQVLTEAAIRIEAKTPWYETLGLQCEEVADEGGDLAVETVLAFNVVSGLIDAASETVLAPVFVSLKGLLGAVQGAAAARQDIVELILYCVGISRCLLEVAKGGGMPISIGVTLGEFKGELEVVGRFVQAYGTQSRGRLRKIMLHSRHRATAAAHKQKLKDLLDAVLAGLAVQTNLRVADIQNTINAMIPPRLGKLAPVPRAAPTLPPTYVQRTALLEAAVADLTDPHRSASVTHCLLGMGGAGKTLMPRPWCEMSAYGPASRTAFFGFQWGTRSRTWRCFSSTWRWSWRGHPRTSRTGARTVSTVPKRLSDTCLRSAQRAT